MTIKTLEYIHRLLTVEEFDEDGGGPVLDVPAAKNEVRA